MKRLAQLLHCPPLFVPLIVLRWLLLLVATSLCLGAVRIAGQTSPVIVPLIALDFAWLYLIAWTLRIRAIIAPSPNRVQLLTLDVALSAATMVAAGSLGDQLAPFALGALVLPSMIYGWAGAGAAVAGFVSIEAFRQYVYVRSPLGPPTVLDYALVATLLAIMSPLSVTFYRHMRRPRRRRTDFPAPRQRSMTSGSGPPASRTMPFTPHVPTSLPTQRVPERLPSTTLERRAMRLHAAVRQVVREAQHQGLQITLHIEGREPTLPPSYAPLIAKATEIALDNVRRHAHTNVAEVHLRHTPERLMLIVRDRGAGLLDGTAELPGFRQLKLLRYRLHEWGGTLEITEPDDEGVLFVLILPFPS